MHPVVRAVADKTRNVNEVGPGALGNSLVFEYRKEGLEPKIALSAHLDKINHYGYDYPDQLPVLINDSYMEGIMDDSTGVGICLTLMELASELELPSCYFFFTDMEEKFGLRHHPELLKNSAEGISHGLGAKTVARYIRENKPVPELVITIDTTPLFQGKKGIALYSKFWEHNSDGKASEVLQEATNEYVAELNEIIPDLLLANNTNDYIHFGNEFNGYGKGNGSPVVSLALEPAIYPYHQKEERVFIDDIRKTLNSLVTFLKKHENKRITQSKIN